MTSTTQTATVTAADITAILIQDGWMPLWARCTNAVADEYGNAVTLHADDESVTVDFEYALGGIVERMTLDPRHGAQRIAHIISAAADAPTE